MRVQKEAWRCALDVETMYFAVRRIDAQERPGTAIVVLLPEDEECRAATIGVAVAEHIGGGAELTPRGQEIEEEHGISGNPLHLDRQRLRKRDAETIKLG